MLDGEETPSDGRARRRGRRRRIAGRRAGDRRRACRRRARPPPAAEPADAAKVAPFELKQQPAVAVEIETLELEQPPADAAKDIRPGWHPALTALLLTALCALVALLNLVNVLNIHHEGYRSALCDGLIGSFCPSLSGSVFGLLGSILFICKESDVDAPRCRTAIAFVAIDQISSFCCFVAIVLMTMFYVEYPASPPATRLSSSPRR